MTSLSDLTRFRSTLTSTAPDLSLEIAPSHLDAFAAHYALLLAHQAEAGLTSLTDPTEVAIKHFLDSLTCLLIRDIAPAESVADIGSGGGFPGLVLAVARPEARYTLIESNRKRAAFLEEAVKALHLDNTTVLTERAETAGRHPDHRDAYHLILSRAVAPLSVALEYALPLARVGGHCLAMKGPHAPDEIAKSDRALSELHGRIAKTKDLFLPHSMGNRTLLLIEKTAPTPDRYPRRPGIPAKRPL
jgi:16S rRNA (guanine527-N7)-methyltransferase